MEGSVQRILLLAVVVALAAVGVGGYRMLAEQQDHLEHLETDLATTNARQQKLTERIEALIRTEGSVGPVPISDAPGGATQTIQDGDASRDAAQQDLETAVAELQERLDDALPKMEKIFQMARAYEEENLGLSQDRARKPTPEELRRSQKEFLSEELTVERKLQMFQQLRHFDALSDDVVRHMVEQYYAANEQNRKDILSFMNGIVTPELRAALLYAAENDQSPDARWAAAGAMRHFLPDSEVQKWLEHLAANDPSWQVRLQASASLNVYLDEAASQESERTP